jgi:hypothetical protein
VIALTAIMAPDWSAASTQLETSLMLESGPFKDMGSIHKHVCECVCVCVLVYIHIY